MALDRARTPILAALLLLLLAAPVSAQNTATIILTTVTGDNCVATTTDPLGLHLLADGTTVGATSVTLSGAACGGGSVPSPTGLALTGPQSSPIAGSVFTVSWTIQGGTPTECDGTATLPVGGGWTTVTSPTPQTRSVTASTAGAYTLTLDCFNQGGHDVASVPVTVLPADNGGCPATIYTGNQALTRLTTSTISYGIYDLTRTADTRNWENIWGHVSNTDNAQLWPGPTSSQPVIRDFGRTTYLAAQFHVPAGFSTTAFGQYLHANNPPGPPVTASFSTTCGDFSPQPGTGCVVQQWPNDFSSALFWKSQSQNPSFCPLQPDTDYYLNMKLSDPATTTWCSAGSATCYVYLQQLHN
jgi:hypothetical protein